MVKETRMTKDNTRKRRYECANTHRFSTLEMILVQENKQSEQQAKRK